MPSGLTLLQIVQTACNELGLQSPAIVVGSPDLQIIQLLALTNRDGINLYQERDWTCLQGEHIVNLETPVNLTGDFVQGGTVISGLSTTADLTANYYIVTGDGQPTSQRVTEIIDGTSVRCEMEFTADGVAADLQFARDTYELPSNFDRYISNTWWDRTNHWMLIGPQSPQFDQWQRSGIVTTGPRIRWRQIGIQPNVFRLWPPPTATGVPDALVFEYVNNGWIQYADGSFGTRFQSDTDIPLLDSDALILGVKWRMWQIKGFDFGGMQSEWMDYVNRLRARDGGMPDLAMGRSKFSYLISSANVQDGNFPGP